MKEKIKVRIEELKAEKQRLAEELAKAANLQLMPYTAAIAELEMLLEEEAEKEPQEEDG